MRQTLRKCVRLSVAAIALTSLGLAQSETPVTPNSEEIARAVEAYLASTRPAPEEKSWERILDRLTLYGDFRLRQESTFSLPNQQSRNRSRFRLRLGANYSLTDDVQIGGRFVTGDPDDPKSTHSTFGDGLNSVQLSVDRAFASWRPESVRGLRLTAGKFGHGFYSNPVYGELVWDGDVQPEGVSAAYSTGNAGPFESLTFRAGEYLILEQSAASDASLFVAQVEGAIRVSEQWKSRFAFGYYDYSNVTPDGSTVLLGENSGNATVDLDADTIPDAFESDFRILNPILSFNYSGFDEPLVFSSEYIKNARAGNNRDTGWSLGAAWGSSRKEGDVRLYYQMQVVEQDAVFSPFSQDDFVFATNHRSHVFGCNYQAADKIGIHLWGLVSDVADPTNALDGDYRWRVRLDLDIKF